MKSDYRIFRSQSYENCLAFLSGSYVETNLLNDNDEDLGNAAV